MMMTGILKKISCGQIILVVLFLSFIAGCSFQKSLTLEDFKNTIFAGMTTEQVKRELGAPELIERNNEKAIAQRELDAEYSIDMWPSEDENFYETFFGGEKKRAEYLEKLRQKEDTSYYQYLYTDNTSEKKEFYIYFIDNEVVWMSFP